MPAVNPAPPAPAIPATPANSELIDLLAYIYLQHNRPDKAAVLLAARDLLAPGNARTLLALAVARLRSGQPQRALEALDRLALLGAMDASFHLVRAQALHALERTSEAAAAMRAYLEQRPDKLPSHQPPASAATHN